MADEPRLSVDEMALAASRGDRLAFVRLVEAHYDRIYRLAWRFCGQPVLAEDIAQDVCVKLAQAIATFRGDSAFTTWLFRLVYTTAADATRRGQRLVLLAPDQMDLVAERADMATPEQLSISEELWAAVRALPPQQRDAVTFVYGEDMSHAEAAQVMGCTESTVSWHLHTARKRLKTTLEAVA